MAIAPVPGGLLEYCVTGRGAPLLMLHGALIADSLDPLAACLARDWEVIQYARRGYAGSSAPVRQSLRDQADDAAALMRYLGHESFDVIGYSYGTTIAMELWSQGPPIIRHAVLIDPVFPNDVKSGAEFWAAEPAAVAAARAGEGRAFVAAVCAALGPDDWGDVINRILGSTALDRGGAAMDAYTRVELPSLRRWRVRLPDPGLAAPPLFVVSGGKSSTLFQESAALLADALPPLNVRTIADATHFVPFSHAEQVATVIAGLLCAAGGMRLAEPLQ